MDKRLDNSLDRYYQDKRFIIFSYLFFYYAVFSLFFFNHKLLSQANPIFFRYNRDLSELFIIATGLPAYMINNKWTYLLADLLLLLSPVIVILHYLVRKKFSIVLGSILIGIVFIYFLLQNILLSNTPNMYFGIVLMTLIFLSNKESSFYAIITLSRYYFLYTMFSAAVWKIIRGAVFNKYQLSNILVFQHGNAIIQDCKLLFCDLYDYLITHAGISYFLYALAIILELFFITGFFTKKYDRILFGLSMLFFTGVIIIMRIPYWPFLLPATTLLLKSSRIPENVFSLREWRKYV